MFKHRYASHFLTLEYRLFAEELTYDLSNLCKHPAQYWLGWFFAFLFLKVILDYCQERPTSFSDHEFSKFTKMISDVRFETHSIVDFFFGKLNISHSRLYRSRSFETAKLEKYKKNFIKYSLMCIRYMPHQHSTSPLHP